MKYCGDLKLEFNCCNACHDDHNEMRYDLLDETYQGDEYYVCCAESTAIDKSKKDEGKV